MPPAHHAPTGDRAGTHAEDPGDDDGPSLVGRRDFLGFVLKGTGLAVAARLGVDAALPAPAGAIDLGDALTVTRLLEAPEFADELDLTDLLLLSGDPFYYDFLIRITPANRIEFELPRMEQGQGIVTTAVMMLAEELDVRLDQVDPSLSPAEIRRSTGQITGGSHATTSLWDPLRRVAATLRAMIVAAAAVEFGTTPDRVTTAGGIATGPGGETATYASLSEGVEGRNDAARLAQPKDPSQYTIIGTPQPRLDARDIVTGRVEYALDMDVVPGAHCTVVLRPPTIGGSVRSFDATAARAMPGVHVVDLVDIGVEREMTGIAVLARSFGEAFRARDAIEVEWNGGIADDLSDADIIETLRAVNLPTVPDVPLVTESVEGEFVFPYIPHAPMETMTAIADARGSTVRIWTGAKTPLAAQAKVARDLGRSPAEVEINVVKSGGSFGRRLFFDAAVEAARISDQFQQPVKLLFTRQDDTKFGRARPLSIHHVRAAYTPGGLLSRPEVVSFDHRCATPELDLRHGFGDAITALGAEYAAYGYSQTIWHTTQIVPYAFGATSLLLNEVRFPMPTSSWRSIYSGTAQVANEVIVDELARAVGHDELRFRLDRLDDDRHIAALTRAADEAQWGRALPAGVAQGIGIHKEYKSRAAVIVELDTRGDEPLVTRATVVLDVNRAVNPTGLEAQAIGAFTDAISAVLRVGIHFENGAVRESSYGDMPFARMRHTPTEIDVHVMPPNGDRPGGAGELVVPAASAAIANAFARATGIAPRRFPLNEHYPEV